MLYLIPSLLGEAEISASFPVFNTEIINTIDYYVVEELRTARRFLRKLNIQKPIDQLQFFLLNEHTRQADLKEYLEPCLEGKNMGLLSEAGTPCVADPGNKLVEKAHQLGIQVKPLIGPNSILLALMASGLNGQNFCFQGYLPVERKQREKELQFCEKIMQKNGQTQIFIETPYRNNHLLESILSICDPNTKLCVAVQLTSPEEFILTQTVAKWKKYKIDLHKKPTIFIIGK
jgi:16S rRNA (cytidine1402-2'-O)-methyltransferase